METSAEVPSWQTAVERALPPLEDIQCIRGSHVMLTAEAYRHATAMADVLFEALQGGAPLHKLTSYCNGLIMRSFSGMGRMETVMLFRKEVLISLLSNMESLPELGGKYAGEEAHASDVGLPWIRLTETAAEVQEIVRRIADETGAPDMGGNADGRDA